MDKKLVKEAFGLAEKEAQREKKEKIKNIILETLKKLEDLKKEKEELDRKIKILKRDLEDFKQGRLDLIEERQKKDELARKISIARVEKIIEHHYYPKPWYEPYKIVWCSSCNSGTTSNLDFPYDGSFTISSSTSTSNSQMFTCAGTDFHSHFSGTYKINDKVINL